MHAHLMPMNTSERLCQLDLEIYEVGHQEHIDVDENIISH
jgi:hypothetical protein